MCGRFSFYSDDEKLEQRFHAKVQGPLFRHYNAAPSQQLPLITNDQSTVIRLGIWGLMPSWLKGKRTTGLINARVETLCEKPAFRNALAKRRCLVIADGFFEWNRQGGRQPYRITLENDEPFAFAGLWELYKTKEGMVIPSFTIITTNSNELIGRIHNRMPVILKPENEQLWLNPDLDPIEELDLKTPFPAGQMKLFEVSNRVNSYANDSPEIIKPV